MCKRIRINLEVFLLFPNHSLERKLIESLISSIIEKNDALSHPDSGIPLMTTFTFKYSFSLKNSSQCCTTVDLLKGAQKCHDNQLVLNQRGLLKVYAIYKKKDKTQNNL